MEKVFEIYIKTTPEFVLDVVEGVVGLVGEAS